MEQPQYAFSHQSAGPPSDLSDQPLDFNPSYNRDHNQHVQSNYSRNAGVPLRDLESPSDVASIHAWSASAAPGVVYPPVHPPGPQVSFQFSFFFPAAFGHYVTTLKFKSITILSGRSFFIHLFTCFGKLWTTVRKDFRTKLPATGSVS